MSGKRRPLSSHHHASLLSSVVLQWEGIFVTRATSFVNADMGLDALFTGCCTWYTVCQGSFWVLQLIHSAMFHVRQMQKPLRLAPPKWEWCRMSRRARVARPAVCGYRAKPSQLRLTFARGWYFCASNLFAKSCPNFHGVPISQCGN